MSFFDGTQSCADSSFHSFSEDDHERITRHALHDPSAKFILSSHGHILCQNLEAYTFLDQGVLSTQADGKLGYGSAELSLAANDILAEFRTGRTSRRKLLKKFQDDWVVLLFSSPEFNSDKEVLLTVQKRNGCCDDSLRALSKAFDFTITEIEVVRHMSMASCPKEISVAMDISINTVRAHLRSIYAKLGVRGYNRSLRVILQLIC